jgi:N-acetylated-alpha-linked acidic dipeptidase
MLILTFIFFRVQKSASMSNISIDLFPLQSAIRALQEASLKLDKEIAAVQAQIMQPSSQNPLRGRSKCCCHRSALRIRVENWIKGLFGVPPLQVQFENQLSQPYLTNEMRDRVWHLNKKLMSFERGFISKEGIKDRQWFKHLGIASGKWLGWYFNLET